MDKKQYAKQPDLATLMTKEQAIQKGWEILDTACSEKAPARAVQLAKVQAKYPIHKVQVVMTIRQEEKTAYSIHPFYAYTHFAIQRDDQRVMGVLEKAIEGLRAKAVDFALKNAKAYIAKLTNNLTLVGWDLNKIQPYVPHSLHRQRQVGYTTAKEEHEKARAIRTAYRVLFDLTERYQSEEVPTFILKQSPESEARYLKMVERDANVEFDAYLFKMMRKLGAVTHAEVTEEYGIFQYSFLRVTLEDGTMQTWKTQQIINYSSLGNAYNQWPTRLMK